MSDLPVLACQLRSDNTADEQLARDVAEFTTVTGNSVSALIRVAVQSYLADWQRGRELRRLITKTIQRGEQ